jgi:hypothetical protein
MNRGTAEFFTAMCADSWGRYACWMGKGTQDCFWQRLPEFTCFNGRLPDLEIVGPTFLGCGPVPNYLRSPFGSG